MRPLYPAEFHNRSEAQGAINRVIRAGDADSGYISGPMTGRGGALIYRAHVHKDATSRCILQPLSL